MRCHKHHEYQLNNNAECPKCKYLAKQANKIAKAAVTGEITAKNAFMLLGNCKQKVNCGG